MNKTTEQKLHDLEFEQDAWKYNFKWVRARLRQCKNVDDTFELLKDVEQVKIR